MTDEEIQALAAQAGIVQQAKLSGGGYFVTPTPILRRFAESVQAAERERCAKLCEAQAAKWGQMRPLDGSMEAALKDAAAAIRANT
jgi:hypothetical protein